MLEIRHLVITVVSIFLALVLGILIGVGFSNPQQLEQLAKDFRAKVQDIERRLDQAHEENLRVQDENHALQAVLERERKAVRSLLPRLVDDSLANQRYVLIQTSSLQDFSFKDPIVQTVQTAGGAVAAVIIVRPALMSLGGLRLEHVLRALNIGPIPPDQSIPKICRQLTRLALQGDPNNRLRALVDRHCIELAGDCTQPADGLILVGGADSKARDHAEEVDLPILTVCKELGKRCVAAEPEKVPVSFMGPYQTTAAATVDNVDQLVGQISLVYALAGADGHFGVKETATKLMPAPPVTAPMPSGASRSL